MRRAEEGLIPMRHPRWLRPLLAVGAVAMTAIVTVPASPPASAALPSRSIAVGPEQGFYTEWTGSVPALSGGLCLPLDVRCDHTLVNVKGFQGSTPCVGVKAHSLGSNNGAHIAVYRVVPGVGVGDPIATSYDGTLLFWGEPNAVYLVSVGSSRTTSLSTGFNYKGEVGTIDIGTGPGIVNGDWLVCLPGVWAADSGTEVVADLQRGA